MVWFRQFSSFFPSKGRDAPVGVATEDHRLLFDGYEAVGVLGPDAEPEPEPEAEAESGADDWPAGFTRLGSEAEPEQDVESGADDGPATFTRGA